MTARRWDQGVVDPPLVMAAGLAIFLFGLGWQLRRGA